jgi:pyruvate,water dikinase
MLQGVPVSSGRASGEVRIVRDPRQAGHLQPGDILVAGRPTGWTPLFPLVAGVIVEIGGQLSHAAIVAREYGVPVVASVRNATRLLRDGQTVTMDGTTGQVYLGPEAGHRGRTG